jgi:hypothetical protein
MPRPARQRHQRPNSHRSRDLAERFIIALGGPSCVTPMQRDQIAIAATLIAAFEKKQQALANTEAAALKAKAWAKISLDALKLPGSSAQMLEGPGLT